MERTGDREINGLIERIAERDRVAFDALYRCTSSRLFAVTLRILRDKSDAEDALQEVYVRVWRRAGSFQPETSNGMAWLVTIARNHSIDRVRARRTFTAPIEMAEAIVDSGPTPETAAELSDTREQLEACLDELDSKRAAAVRAAYIEGWSYAELAQHYSTPINTMRSWLRRSLLRLKSCLEGEVS